ncbi:MAG TPA: hypothetical protein VNR86_08030 [Sphingomicrobium sp.]|nr:hypothetical protein [Sphingomicrobium sp.]
MSQLLIGAARWGSATLSLLCFLALWFLDLRSGPALALFVLFVLFAAPAILLWLHVPFPQRTRRRKS